MKNSSRRNSWFCCLGLACLALAAWSWAAEGGEPDYPIVITLDAGDIDLSAIVPDYLHFGYVAPESAVLSNQIEGNPRCTIQNNGYATVDYTVSAAVTGWTLGTHLEDIGPDQCVIAAIFTAPILESQIPFPWGRDLETADFGNEDVVGPAPKVATDTVLARNNTRPDPDDPDILKGFAVSPLDSTRSLRFLVRTPAGVVFEPEQVFTVTIGAVVR
ncbi:MAG: hypothetical protein AB1439_08945 [candidate division FCPU426 bacterium]